MKRSALTLVLSLALFGGVPAQLAATPAPPDAAELAAANAKIEAWFAAHCADGCKPEVGEKLDGALLNLVAPLPAPRGAEKAGGRATGLRIVGPAVSDGAVELVAHLAPGRSLSALEKELSPLGFEVTARHATALSGRLPVASLAALDDCPSLGHAATTSSEVDSGVAETAGDIVQGSAELRRLTGLTGAYVPVGVISDSYDCLGGAAADVASGDLPPNVTVLRDDQDCDELVKDEGRAIAQIIHDIAPGAKIFFHTSEGSGLDFVEAARALAEAGVSILVEDITFPGEPVYQDGLISQGLAEIVREHGVTIFSSVGNTGRQRSWEGPFSSEVNISPFGDLMQWLPDRGIGNGLQLPAGRRTTVALHWDQPYRSVSGGQGAVTDLDLFVFNRNGEFQDAARAFNRRTGEPVEVITIENNVSDDYPILVVSLAAGPQPGRVRVTSTRADFGFINAFTFSDSILGQKNSPAVISVGAADYRSFPEFLPEHEPFDGIEIEAFSSVGGTPILFDGNGDRTFIVREKPEIVGPNRGNTTFFGRDLDSDDDTLPNFAGTSASAPHVAALTALLVEAAGWAVPDVGQVRTLLTSTAIDMDDPFTEDVDVGFDFGTGYGFVDGLAAAAVIAGGNSPPTVDAGPDLITEVGVPVTLRGAVRDDGLPLWGGLQIGWQSFHWSPVTFLTPADQTSVSVEFHYPGHYWFQLQVSDGDSWITDNVYVQVVGSW